LAQRLVVYEVMWTDGQFSLPLLAGKSAGGRTVSPAMAQQKREWASWHSGLLMAAGRAASRAPFNENHGF
jgi:hypothetical protein